MEVGYECSRVDNTAANPDVCTLLCGNGALNSGELCDDNNESSGDGCSSSCSIESGYECNRLDLTAANPDLCTVLPYICGNGVIEGEEECDTIDGGDTSVLCN